VGVPNRLGMKDWIVVAPRLCGKHPGAHELMPRKLTPEQARAMAAARKRNGAGPGRPRSEKPRCPCGAMTAKRAAAVRHRCATQEKLP